MYAENKRGSSTPNKGLKVVRSNKHEAKPDFADATTLLKSFPLGIMLLKCKCYDYTCVLSLSKRFQEIALH